MGGSPLSRIDAQGLAWGDGRFDVGDVFFGPIVAASNMANFEPSLPSGLVNFSAGMGDALSFGITDVIREWNGQNGVVDKCSGYYAAGGWAGFAVDLLSGGALIRAGLKSARWLAKSAARGMPGEGHFVLAKNQPVWRGDLRINWRNKDKSFRRNS